MTQQASEPDKTEVETVESIQVLFQPVRFKIYKYLRENGGAYISKIADDLGEDRQLITHHLMTLAKNGFVEGEYEVSKEPASKGRATKVYNLTDKADEIKPAVEDLLE